MVKNEDLRVFIKEMFLKVYFQIFKNKFNYDFALQSG